MTDAGGSGQHKIIDIADIFQSLGNKRWTGTLQVMSRGKNVYLFFRDGTIHHSKADSSKVVLGRALFKLGKLDEADLNLALNDFETAGKRIGQACVELGLVQPDDIKEALAFQAREGVLDLFTWEDVDARFHPNDPPLPAVFSAEDLDVRLNLAPMGLLMEAARRSDEWSMIKESLPSLDDVVVSLVPPGSPVPASDRRTLALVDGYRTASEIADAAPGANFEVLKHLSELIKKGSLRRLEAVELAKVALEAEREQNLEKALKLYELAGSRGLGDRVDLAKRIARVYQLLGQTGESLSHWLRLAKRCEDAGRPDQAIEAYRAALALDPVRVEAHERLAAILVAQDRKDEAALQFKFLIEQLGRSDPVDKEKLLHTYEQLLDLTPEDEVTLRRISELHVERGEKVQAIVRLDELAQVYLGRNQRDEAIQVYYKVLEIDEECLEGRLALAQCLAAIGSTDDAVREYKRLADTLYRSGLIGNSINWSFLFKVYESIVEIEPSSTPAWEWLAKAYAENGQTDLAISRYLGMAQSLEPKDANAAPPPEILVPLRKVVELAPKNVDVRRRLATAYLALHQTEKAVRALFELGQVLVDEQQLPPAIEALEDALHSDPFHVDSRKLLADLLERTGARGKAFQAWADLGGLCLRAGLHGEAADACRRALALEPEDAQVLHDCARAEELRGRSVDAAALYGKLAHVESARENAGRARAAQEKAREVASRPQAGARSSGRIPIPPGVPAPLPAMPAQPRSGTYKRLPDGTIVSATDPGPGVPAPPGTSTGRHARVPPDATARNGSDALPRPVERPVPPAPPK